MIIFRLTSFFHEYIFFVCWTLFLLDHRCSFMMWWRKNSFRMDFKYHGKKCQFQMECDKFFYILIPFIEDYYRAKLSWSIVKIFECSSASIYTRLMTLVKFWSCLSIFEKQNNILTVWKYRFSFHFLRMYHSLPSVYILANH